MRERSSSRLVPLAFGVACLLVGAAAVTFARADQAQRLAGDAMELQAAEAALSDVATYRADLAIAVVAATTSHAEATVTSALTAAGRALSRLEAELASLDDPRLDRLLAAVSDGHEAVGARIRAGDVDAADEVAAETILPALASLGDALGERSASIVARIEAERDEAGRLARASSFTVALLAPALGLWSVRRSARRRMARQQLVAELERERQLAAAKDQLIAGLSHQLRTPLTGIYGFADTLLDAVVHDEADPHLLREVLVTILGEAHHLTRMVEDILVTARADADTLSFSTGPVEVGPEVDAAVAPFRKAGAEVAVEVERATVVVDARRLHHILRNLVANGTRHGGGVTVRGRCDGDRYLLEVEDEGPGVPDEVADRLFTPFVHAGTEATVTGSLGLGLSVARTLAIRMGATLAYERSEGVTCFVLNLPTAEMATVAAASATA